MAENSKSGLPSMEVTAADLARQVKSLGTITIEVDPLTALSVVSQIQLASQHPANMGPQVKRACQFADELTKRLPLSAQEVVMAGWATEDAQ